jgi:ribosomal protein S18 acetylase RimI-like enzyme
MLHAFPMDNGPTPEEASEPMDPVLQPYARLEVPGSYYTSGMAVFPECRGKGLGARMLKMAAQEARERQCREVSLLAFEKNEGAIKPHERDGFRIVDRAPMVPHEFIRYTGEVLLITAFV